jgi:hypothetical protein
MDISKMTNELSTIVYLNNDRVSTKFSLWKIGNVTLYAVKRKAYADIEKILKIDYNYFEFVKHTRVFSKDAGQHKSLGLIAIGKGWNHALDCGGGPSIRLFM